MLERLIITTLLIIIGTGAYATLKRRHVRVIGGLDAVTAGPTVLYFASESCAACPSQERYLQQLVAKHDGLEVQKIDAELEQETAAKYRVFTLPTTILLDPQGEVREINYGLTHTQKLIQQVTKIVNGENL